MNKKHAIQNGQEMGRTKRSWVKKAFIFPKYSWKEIYGKIGIGFRTNGSNSRRQLAKDLTT